MTVSRAGLVCVACVLALVCAQSMLPLSARACARAAVFHPAYAIDAALQASDRQQPSPFTEVSAFAFKIEDTVCRPRGPCMVTSCPDSGGIELTFADPVDDQTPRDQLGYRIVVLAGTLPTAMLADVATPRPLAHALSFEVGFDEVARLDAVIALVAIDRAGNESAPSAPIALHDSGCTRTWLQLLNIDTRAGCLEDAAEPGTQPADCSVRSTPRGDASRLVAALPLAALALLRRKRWT